MGVRITAFGVNIEDLNAALAEPMSTHLLRWLSVAEDEVSPTLDCWDHATRVHYFAWLDHGVFVRTMPGRDRREASRERIDDTKVGDVEFLRVPAIDYLRTASSFELCRFLRLLSFDPERRAFVITEGLKRWWVDSLLDVVNSTYMLMTDDKKAIDQMMRKLLRVYYSNARELKDRIRIADFNLPITPNDDVDKWMGVWDHEEIRLFSRVTETFRDTKAVFERPRRLRSYADDDTDWNEWVWRMIDRFDDSRWTTPGIERVVSFIS